MGYRRIIPCIAVACIFAPLLGAGLNVGSARENLFPTLDIYQTQRSPYTLSPTPVPAASIYRTSPETRLPSPPVSSGGTSPFPGDWSQLLPTLLATFLGAGLALITAIWVARVDARRSRAREAHANVVRFRELLNLIGREIAWNQREISVVLRDLKSGLFTDRSPVIDVWASNGQEILKTSSTATAGIAEAYALLRRFARLLDQYRAEVTRGGTDARAARIETLPKLQALGHEARFALEAASKCAEKELSKNNAA